MLEPGYRFMLEHYFGALAETNLAWAAMLVETGIVEPEAGARLLEAVVALEQAGPEALGEFDPRYEYFYSHMEHWLIEHAGEEVAGEINIGRTRPEPLTRMALRARLLGARRRRRRACRTLLDMAEREAETVMPQWTHFQHAQLSTLGHYLAAIVNALERDADRLLAAFRTTNQCTLGCGALAGTSYPVDRDLVAELLGFDGVRENTIDAVSGGDHVLEATSAIAGLMVNLSRFSQDFYIWHTEEFGFLLGGRRVRGLELDDAAEEERLSVRVRARPRRPRDRRRASAYGTLHNTNYQDIKDVEEEMVPPAFRSLEEAARAIRLLEGTVSTMEIRRERMLEQAGRGFAAATELAATIHRAGGVSARTAHRVVGHLVLQASKQGKRRPRRRPRAGAGVRRGRPRPRARRARGRGRPRAMDPRAFVDAHDVPGGPAPARVREAIAAARGTTATAGRPSGRRAGAHGRRARAPRRHDQAEEAGRCLRTGRARATSS